MLSLQKPESPRKNFFRCGMIYLLKLNGKGQNWSMMGRRKKSAEMSPVPAVPEKNINIAV